MDAVVKTGIDHPESIEDFMIGSAENRVTMGQHNSARRATVTEQPTQTPTVMGNHLLGSGNKSVPEPVH